MTGDSRRVDPHAARSITVRTRTEAASIITALESVRAALDDAGGVLAGTASSDALHALREDPFGIELRSVHDHVETAAGDVDASIAAYGHPAARGRGTRAHLGVAKRWVECVRHPGRGRPGGPPPAPGRRRHLVASGACGRRRHGDRALDARLHDDRSADGREPRVTGGLIFAIVGLAVGIPAYLGLWRSWTGVDGNKAWARGFLWIGLGGVLLVAASFFPLESGPYFWLGGVGAVIGVLGMCSCYWMPPFLRPRWYRAQYTPLFARRRG